jgi:hypothetical protein
MHTTPARNGRRYLAGALHAGTHRLVQPCENLLRTITHDLRLLPRLRTLELTSPDGYKLRQVQQVLGAIATYLPRLSSLNLRGFGKVKVYAGPEVKTLPSQTDLLPQCALHLFGHTIDCSARAHASMPIHLPTRVG